MINTVCEEGKKEKQTMDFSQKKKNNNLINI